MFYAEKFVPEILHHFQKAELELVEALPRKSQNTLSVSKQTNKQTNKQVNEQEIAKTRHR